MMLEALGWKTDIQAVPVIFQATASKQSVHDKKALETNIFMNKSISLGQKLQLDSILL